MHDATVDEIERDTVDEFERLWATVDADGAE